MSFFALSCCENPVCLANKKKRSIQVTNGSSDRYLLGRRLQCPGKGKRVTTAWSRRKGKNVLDLQERRHGKMVIKRKEQDLLDCFAWTFGEKVELRLAQDRTRSE